MVVAGAQRGFSLIELMVVLIIVVVAISGVAISIGAVGQTQLRSSCWTLASAARYAYTRATTYGTTTRVVMDFGKRTIQLQETEGRLVLTRDDTTGEGLRTAEEADEPDAGTSAGESKSSFELGPTSGMSGGMGMGMGMGMGLGGGMGDGLGMEGMFGDLMGGRLIDPFLSSMQGDGNAEPVGYRRPRFKALPGRRGEARELEGNTVFVRVFTPHEPTPREEGRAFIYFFPNGMGEHAIAQLADGEQHERIYSVETHPLSGRSIIHTIEVEPEEELDELQEAEE